MSIAIKCRAIEADDLPAVTTLLTYGFRDQRDRAYWVRALGHLAERALDDDVPRFGYLLEASDRVVGVILLIFARVPDGDRSVLRCNLSSWFVQSEFRAFGPLLISRALRHRDATYTNLTPAPHTFDILEAQRFKRFCEGRVLAVPTLAALRGSARVERFRAGVTVSDGLSVAETSLLQSHQAHGCLCAVATEAGRRLPFVFAPRHRAMIGLALLAYCRDIDDVVRLAAPLGWHLLRRGYPIMVIDANGPIRGLVGRYSPTKPKYARGPFPPRLGDTAYSERTMFGS